MNDLRDALKSDDINRIRRASESLQATMSRIGQNAYASQPGTGGATPSSDGKGDEGVVEGEYRSV